MVEEFFGFLEVIKEVGGSLRVWGNDVEASPSVPARKVVGN